MKSRRGRVEFAPVAPEPTAPRAADPNLSAAERAGVAAAGALVAELVA
ncbi:hypothetical protein ACFY7C_34270 [Streptomyces sp. NPDC012769]